jgi:hypothetical protein
MLLFPSFSYEPYKEEARMELINVEFDGYFKFLKFLNQGIKFDNGVEIWDSHDQDCCESVYADWQALDNTYFTDADFDKLKIEVVDGVGIRINEYLVPCYDEQNGYYSSNLKLHFKASNGAIATYDITDSTHFIDR